MENRKEQIDTLLKKMVEAKPFELFNQIDETNKGMGFILGFLYKTKGDVYSIDIANALDVSTARIAVLLKKLEASELIIKSKCLCDARKIKVSLTDKGILKTEEAIEFLYSYFDKILSVVTIDEFNEFIRISEKIQNAIKLY